jgi:hypothetical protein
MVIGSHRIASAPREPLNLKQEQGMEFDTFEERQAYIEQCQRDIREAEAKMAEQRLRQLKFDLAMQSWHLQYEVWVWTELAPLIYRGMFDPTFCRPSDTGAEMSDWQHCAKCGELFTGRGGQWPLPPQLTCPNGHQWEDPNGWAPSESPRFGSSTAEKHE